MNNEAIKEIEEQIEKMEETKQKRIEHTKATLLRQMRAEAKKTLSVRGVESFIVKMKDLFGYGAIKTCGEYADKLSQGMIDVGNCLEEMDIADADKVAEFLEDRVDYSFAYNASKVTSYDMVFECLWMDFIASVADVTDRLQQFITEADNQIDECKAKLTELSEEE